MTGGNENGSHDVELNLAPIIDCFTVLITYLLVSASFISLSVLEVGVAASGPATAGNSQAPVTILIKLDESHAVQLSVTGGDANWDLKETVSANQSGEWNFAALKSRIESLSKKGIPLKEATLTTGAAATYLDLVQMVEALRKTIPKIYLAG